MPFGKEHQRRRRGGQKTTGQSAGSCRCSDQACGDRPAIVSSRSCRPRRLFARDENNLLVCSKLAAVVQQTTPVCLWESRHLDQILAEGSRLAKRESAFVKDTVWGNHVQSVTLNGKSWMIHVDEVNYQSTEVMGELEKRLESILLHDNEVCLLHLNKAVSLLVRHKNYFATVDCGERNGSGMAADLGISRIVWNNSIGDLVQYIKKLGMSLRSDFVGVRTLKVKEKVDQTDSEGSIDEPVVLSDEEGGKCQVSMSAPKEDQPSMMLPVEVGGMENRNDGSSSIDMDTDSEVETFSGSEILHAQS